MREAEDGEQVGNGDIGGRCRLARGGHGEHAHGLRQLLHEAVKLLHHERRAVLLPTPAHSHGRSDTVKAGATQSRQV